MTTLKTRNPEVLGILVRLSALVEAVVVLQAPLVCLLQMLSPGCLSNHIRLTCLLKTCRKPESRIVFLWEIERCLVNPGHLETRILRGNVRTWAVFVLNLGMGLQEERCQWICWSEMYFCTLGVFGWSFPEAWWFHLLRPL